MNKPCVCIYCIHSHLLIGNYLLFTSFIILYTTTLTGLKVVRVLARVTMTFYSSANGKTKHFNCKTIDGKWHLFTYHLLPVPDYTIWRHAMSFVNLPKKHSSRQLNCHNSKHKALLYTTWQLTINYTYVIYQTTGCVWRDSLLNSFLDDRPCQV